MAGFFFEDTKDFWLYWSSDYLNNFNLLCPGRKKNGDALVNTLRFNAIISFVKYLNIRSYKQNEFADKMKHCRFCSGFIINGIPESGRFHFCHSIAASHPLLRRISLPYSTLNLRHVKISQILTISIDVSAFVEQSPSSVSSQILSSFLPKQYNSKFVVDLLKNEKTFNIAYWIQIIHNQLVADILNDSSLEGILRSITYTGNIIKALFKYICTNKRFNVYSIKKKPQNDIQLFYYYSGGGSLFVILKNIDVLSRVKKSNYTDSTFIKELMATVKPHTEAIISTLLQTVLQKWNNDFIPINFFSTFNLNQSLTTNTSLINPYNERSNNIDLFKDYLCQSLGGFEKIIHFESPLSYSSREDILNILLQQFPLSDLKTNIIQFLLKTTTYYQPVEIKSVINEAIRLKSLEIVSHKESMCIHHSPNSLSKVIPDFDYFEKAVCCMIPSTSRIVFGHIEGYPSLNPTLCIEDILETPLPDTLTSTGLLKSDVWESVRNTFIAPFIHEGRRGWLTPLCIFEGETGSGKSYLAKSIAQECNVPCFVINASDIMKPLLGNSEKSLSHTFELARRVSPSIILFENADLLCPKDTAWRLPTSQDDYIQFKAHSYELKDHMSQQPFSVTVRVACEMLRQLDCLRLESNILSYHPYRLGPTEHLRHKLSIYRPVIPTLCIFTIGTNSIQLDPRLLMPHRLSMTYKLSNSWSLNELYDLFLFHIPFKRFTVCHISKHDSLKDAIYQLIQQSGQTPAYISRLCERVVQTAVRRQIQQDQTKKIHSDSFIPNAYQTHEARHLNNIANTIQQVQQDEMRTDSITQSNGSNMSWEHCTASNVCICDINYCLIVV